MKKVYYLLCHILILLSLFGCHHEVTTEEDLILVDPVIDGLLMPSSVEEGMIVLVDYYEDIAITWSSSDINLISLSGEVTRVYVDTSVTLTAHYVFDHKQQTKTFLIVITGKPLSSLEIVEMDKALLNLPIETRENLILPNRGEHGSVIVWSSSLPHVISKSGIYFEPIDRETVVLTASIRFEDAETTKTFEVIALEMSDSDKVNKDYVMLDLRIPNPLTHLTLPSRGYFTSSISWTSSHPDIISHTGIYTKPIGEVNVSMIATITKGDYTMEKTFNIDIIGYDPEDIIAEIDKMLLINHGIDVIFENVNLQSRLFNLVDITWASSHPEILSNAGIFSMPNETTTITLSAYMHIADQDITKDFTFTFYGLNEVTSDIQNQMITQKNFDLSQLFYIDEKEDLTLGIFDGVMYKNERLLLMGNRTQGSYTSPILHANYALKRLNFMWGTLSHQTAKTSFYIRYLTSSGWSDYIHQGTWGYGGANNPPNVTLFLPDNIYDVQYKVVFSRDTLVIPSAQLTMVSMQPITDFKVSYDINTLRTSVLYNVPQLKQADTKDAFLWNNICWATSISMMLQYYNKLTDLDIPQEYYSVLIRQGTERFGTTKNDIGSTQFGVNLHELEFHSAGMLLYVLNHYGPLIIGVSKGQSPTGAFGPISFSSGHVVVVVGYNIKENGSIEIIINDPAVSWMRHTISGSLEELMLVWDKGGMLMLPKQ